MKTDIGQSIGRAFAEFQSAILHNARAQRLSFLKAIGTRHRIEWTGSAYAIGPNAVVSERDIGRIVAAGWDGSPEHADELLGDFLNGELQ